MQVLITKHARQRFKQRIIDIPWSVARRVIRAMLSQTVDYEGRDVKVCSNKRAWLHPTTGTVFVVNLSVANQIQVVTVMKAKYA